jgi:hypothetical protein
VGLFTKILNTPQCKFKIKKREVYNKKGILEKEYYTVSELHYEDRVSRFDETHIKHRAERWETMSEYEWVGFKSELGPRRIFDGYTEFSLEQAQNYIKARQEDAPVSRTVETEISESTLTVE